MSVLRTIGAPFRRLPTHVSGQTVVTYAIVACLLAAALVLASSVWKGDSLLADRRPAAEQSR